MPEIRLNGKVVILPWIFKKKSARPCGFSSVGFEEGSNYELCKHDNDSSYLTQAVYFLIMRIIKPSRKFCTRKSVNKLSAWWKM